MARRTLEEQITVQQERLRQEHNKLRTLKAKEKRRRTTQENRGRFLIGGGLAVLVRNGDSAAAEVARRIRTTYHEDRDIDAIDALLKKETTGGTDDGNAERTTADGNE